MGDGRYSSHGKREAKAPNRILTISPEGELDIECRRAGISVAPSVVDEELRLCMNIVMLIASNLFKFGVHWTSSVKEERIYARDEMNIWRNVEDSRIPSID